MAIVTRQFVTTGMHCPSCSAVIQMDLADLVGVVSASSDHRTAITEVTYDEDVTGPDDIIGVIVKAGYGAELA
ncbi:MAG: heavy-metal-associated domain-containing protein, partial [Coriobacteriia bacterium]|nr:heavy-metal-associated domain-containing protein [Coriobacteriia bacterium]